MRAAAWILLATLGLGERASEACSCDGSTRVLPGDGETGVPLNARLFVQQRYGFQAPSTPTLRRRDDGAPVALALEAEGPATGTYVGWAFLRPVEPLAPDTAFEVVVTWSESEGEMIASTFTTGTELDTTPPTFAGITALAPQRWRPDGTWSSSCWSQDGTDLVELDHAPLPDDALASFVEVWPEDDPARVWRSPANPVYIDVGVRVAWSLLSSDSCALSGVPPIEEDTIYCARLAAFDVAGNLAGGDAVACASSATCLLPAGESAGPNVPCTSPGGGDGGGDGGAPAGDAGLPGGAGCGVAGPRPHAPWPLLGLAIAVWFTRRTARRACP